MKLAHIGLPKTASTYLQLHYFSSLGLPFYSTQVPFKWPAALDFVYDLNALWYHDLLRGENIESRRDREDRYQCDIEERLGSWEVAAHNFMMAHRHCNVLLSSEGLFGIALPVARVNAALLKLAGVERIVFITRRQTNYALSLWRQFLLAEDRFAGFVPFDALFCAAAPSQGVMDLDWASYMEIYDGVFGRENVLALPYEFLISSPQDFYDRCNRFLEVGGPIAPPQGRRENPSRLDDSYEGLKGDWSLPLSRLPKIRARLHVMFRRYPRMVRMLRIGRSWPMKVPIDCVEHIRLIHRESNERLAERMQIDLSGYDYY